MKATIRDDCPFEQSELLLYVPKVQQQNFWAVRNRNDRRVERGVEGLMIIHPPANNCSAANLVSKKPA
jgi:hypothetical protein